MDRAPIILLLAGGTLAWLSTRQEAGAAAGGESPVQIEKLGGDVKFPQEADTIAELRKLMTDTLMRGGVVQFSSPEFQLALETPIQGTNVEGSSTTTTIPETTTVDLLPEGKYALVFDTAQMATFYGLTGFLYWYEGDATPIWSMPPYEIIPEKLVNPGSKQTDYMHTFWSPTAIHPASVKSGNYFTIRRT